MVGQEKNDESLGKFLDPLETSNPEGAEWEWEDEAKRQRIRKRKVPVWEEGSSRKKGQGGTLRKRK